MNTPTASLRPGATAPQLVAAAASASPFMSAREVQARTGLGLSTIYKWAGCDRFPAPLDLSDVPQASGRRGKVVWLRIEVEAWIEQRITRARPNANLQPA